MEGLRIDAVDVHIVALPMVEPFVAAHGTVDRRTVVLVRVTGPDGEGWGECGALPEPTYSAEWVDGAFAMVVDVLAPRLLAASEVSASSSAMVFADIAGNPMAKAAIELALLDLEGRRSGTALARRLAPHPPGPGSTVPTGVALGLHPTPDALADAVRVQIEAGHRRIKLKIAPGHDLDHVRAARDAAGPEIVLLADANGAYRWDVPIGDVLDARRLVGLDAFDLVAIEQPLPADDLLDSAELARRLRTPIALDESLTSPDRIVEALDLGAGSVLCVKAPMLGSWLAAASVLDRCAALGLDAYVGGMLDGGIARAASIALAAHPGATLAGDLSPTARFFTDDVCAPFVASQGSIDVPDAGGLGITVLDDAIARLGVRSTTVTR